MLQKYNQLRINETESFYLDNILQHNFTEEIEDPTILIFGKTKTRKVNPDIPILQNAAETLVELMNELLEAIKKTEFKRLCNKATLSIKIQESVTYDDDQAFNPIVDTQLSISCEITVKGEL